MVTVEVPALVGNDGESMIMEGVDSEMLTEDRKGGLLIGNCWRGRDLGGFRSTTLETAGCDRALSTFLLSWKVVVSVMPLPRADLNIDGFAPRAALDVPPDGNSTTSEFRGGAMVDIEDGLKSGPAF